MSSLSEVKYKNLRLSLDSIQKMSDVQRDQVRYLCQTDLAFLANCILRPNNARKYPPLVESVHGKIIDAFPKPDPNKPWDEWDTRDEFLVLASRGMLKSTIGMAFLTQLILCDPDIRILIMSGKIDKAKSILAGARAPFLRNEVIQALFPEWSVLPDDTTAEEFWCPRMARDENRRDATLTIASFDSVKAGGHYELILLDDATNEINSSTIENCEKTHGTYDDTDALMEPGGYRVFLATRWHEEDLPHYIFTKATELTAETGEEMSCSRLVLPAWTLKTDGNPREVAERIEREKTGMLKESDVNLTWPEKLTWKFLAKRYRKNRADFYKQYLLDASVEDTPRSFPEIVLQRQFTSPNDLLQIPYHDRAVVAHWDFASALTGRRKKSESDYSCGVICVFQISTMRMWVVQVVLARFVGSKDASAAVVHLYHIAEMYGNVVGHSIEDAAGARWLLDDIADVVRSTAKPDDPPFMSPLLQLPDNELNAKNSRIANLASAMQLGHVFIMANIQFSNETRVQFEKWTIDAKRRKDDAPDAIAQVWLYYRPQIIVTPIAGLQSVAPVVPLAPAPAAEEPNVEDSLERQQQQLSAEDFNHTFAPYTSE